MFTINYRITDQDYLDLQDLSQQDIDQGAAIDGFFELVVNDKIHGDCPQGPLHPVIEGWDLITDLLETLLEVLIMLQEGHEYVAMLNIDVHNSWIEFKQPKPGLIALSDMVSEGIGSGLIITRQPPDATYKWSNEIISYDEMLREVITKAEQYRAHIGTINKTLVEGRRFTKFKDFIDTVKKLNNIAIE